MCGCEPGYTCTRCADTPADPRYLDEADPREDEAAERVEALAYWIALRAMGEL